MILTHHLDKWDCMLSYRSVLPYRFYWVAPNLVRVYCHAFGIQPDTACVYTTADETCSPYELFPRAFVPRMITKKRLPAHLDDESVEGVGVY